MLWRLAQAPLGRVPSVILELGFGLRAERDDKRLAARALAAAVELRYLDPPLAALWCRLEARNARIGADGQGTTRVTRTDLVRWSGLFQAPDAEEPALFDPPDPA